MISRPMKDLEFKSDQKPSDDYVRLIKNFIPSHKDRRISVRKIMQKGYEEGFGELEIILLARKILRAFLSRSQLNYWFPIKSKWKRMTEEESSSQHSQKVNNNVKNDIEKSKTRIASQTGPDNATLLEFKDHSEGETQDQAADNSNSIQNLSKETSDKTSGSGPKKVSYFDLKDPNLIDCTNHPMYRRACKKIEQLKKILSSKFDKKASSLGEENRTTPHDTDREDL